MKIARIKIIRDLFTPTTSSGLMFINGEFFCYTLEDVARAEGIKISGVTAIGAGFYDVMLTQSTRFKRLMPLIYNQKDLSIDNKGIQFTGVRMHGGNTHINTDACICVAFNRINANYIWKTAEYELVKELKKYDKITLEIINKAA